MELELTDAQWKVLRTFTTCGRCVGSSRTDEETGFVHITAARSLVALGLASEELGAMGKFVFTLSDAGRVILGES